MLIEAKVANQLLTNRLTLSIAESCTGGLLSHRLTNISGSSNFLKIGVVAYSNDAKSRILKIPAATIKKNGAVSEVVALGLAAGVRKLHQTDFGIGLTGIAGPDGGSKRKPVGLVYIAVNTKSESICLKCQFKGTRASIKRQASTFALKLLLEFLT